MADLQVDSQARVFFAQHFGERATTLHLLGAGDWSRADRATDIGVVAAGAGEMLRELRQRYAQCGHNDKCDKGMPAVM